MTVLALNTASPACDLALVRGGCVLAELRALMARGQDGALPGLVDALLSEAGCPLEDISRIAVIVGPGSFTGVRIGTAYARGLALVLDVPCLGITSLEACVAPDALPVRVALQAQRRPPDLTFWTQQVGAEGSSPEEWPLDRVLSWSGPMISDRPDLVSGAKTGEPRAALSGMRAETADPGSHPPAPVYVRPPDAALPGGR